MATMRSLGATASGLSSQLIVEYLGYAAAFSACGIVGTAAAVLLWLGLPQRKPSPANRGGPGRGRNGSRNPKSVYCMMRPTPEPATAQIKGLQLCAMPLRPTKVRMSGVTTSGPTRPMR